MLSHNYESGTILVYSLCRVFALRTSPVTGYRYEGKPLCDTVVTSTTVYCGTYQSYVYSII